MDLDWRGESLDLNLTTWSILLVRALMPEASICKGSALGSDFHPNQPNLVVEGWFGGSSADLVHGESQISPLQSQISPP